MAQDLQPFEKTVRKLTVREIIFNNFLGGLMWALGATVGLSIIFTLLSILARNIDFVPIIGSFVSEIIDYILSHNNRIA